jgi:peroxiredoxin Q/BCP
MSPQEAPLVQLKDVDGNIITFGHGSRTLLTFYHDPACPFCNLHLYQLTDKFKKLDNLGLQIVVAFSADPSEIKRFVLARPRPFPVAADPNREVYEVYRIEKSFMKKLLAVITRPIVWIKGMSKVGFVRSVKTLGGVSTANNMPADFLIDESGKIVEAYYGKDAGDHISFERVDYFASKGLANKHSRSART